MIVYKMGFFVIKRSMLDNAGNGDGILKVNIVQNKTCLRIRINLKEEID